MGCASSKLDNEEKVVRCKERKKLMRQALNSRNEFAAAQMAYLQALRNTGVTLRQFAEVESMELHRASPYNNFHRNQITLPPSPPPLPPPPPPLPALYLPQGNVSPFHRSASSNFSSIPDHLTDNHNNNNNNSSSSNKPASPPKHSTASTQNWNSQIDSDTETPTPPPPPPAQVSAWDFWDPFCTSFPAQVSEHRSKQVSEDELKKQQQQIVEEEQWDETRTEFEDEQELETNKLPDKYQSPGRETDDNSSMVSWYSKSTDLAMVISRKHKNLGEIVRELDEYFLKASAGGKEVSRVLEANKGYLDHNFGETKGNSYHSAKVFSALSWSWSSKSLLSGRDSIEFQNIDDSGRRGSHCSTLEKLHAWEKRLYEEVRSGESAKIDHEKKLTLLHRQESKSQDEKKIGKTRATIAILKSQILAARQAVKTSSESIFKLREDELYPQLVELSEGLMRMWRSMYECHQVQSHIVQQINHLDSLPSTEATSDYHRQATIQLETEVTAWYISFCSLIRNQRNYVQALNGWMRLSLYHLDNETEENLEYYPLVSALLEEWQQALDRLPDKAASEAIKSFVTVVHAMVVQQAEEQKHRRKSERLSKELEKKLASLLKMENKFSNTTPGKSTATHTSGSGPSDPLAEKKAKVDAFRRKVDDEKLKHINSIRVTRAMTLNNLQTSLPNVFQAMTVFSSVCMQQFESVHNQTKSFRF